MSISDQEYEEMKANARKRGRNLITVGLILVVAGLVLLVWGIVDVLNIDIESGLPFLWKMIVGGALSSIGIIPFGVGMYFYMASKMDKIAKFYSRATGPAMRYTTENVTDGFATGLQKHGMSLGGKETIKVKCRNCGYLESEDAEFCSKCGQSI